MKIFSQVLSCLFGARAIRGAALITSLVILAVLGAPGLGVSTMTATTTELQIANDMEAEARSFQAAEAGLTAAARMILDGVLSPDTDVGEIDFSSFDPNPLADMGTDLPVVDHTGSPGGRRRLRALSECVECRPDPLQQLRPRQHP
jgi:hypothetical protein